MPARVEASASNWRCRPQPGLFHAAEGVSARSAELAVRLGARGSCSGWWS
jgi:hypothetical protein